MDAQQTIDNLASLPLTEALWWFIENADEDMPGRTDVFFALRQRIRTTATTHTVAPQGWESVGPAEAQYPRV